MGWLFWCMCGLGGTMFLGGIDVCLWAFYGDPFGCGC